MKVRLPHPWLSVYWGVWVLSSIPVAIATAIPGGALYGLLWWVVWALAFLIAEIPAALVDTGMRDTLSEVVTWMHRKLARVEAHFRWNRGWTAMVSSLIVVVSFTSTLPWGVASVTVGGLIGTALGVVMGLQWYLVGRWLYDHWVLTELFG